MKKLTKHQEYQLYFDSAIKIFEKEFGVTLKKKQIVLLESGLSTMHDATLGDFLYCDYVMFQVGKHQYQWSFPNNYMTEYIPKDGE